MSSSVRGGGGELTMYLKHYQTCQVNFVSCAMRGGSSMYLKARVKLLLLLVDYTQAEVNLVGLLKVWLHLHNLREGLFGVI